MSNNLDYHRSRYILIKHDPDGQNHEYLYAYSRIIETIGPLDSKNSVDIVQIVGPDPGDESAEYSANHQLGRYQDGMEGRSYQVFRYYFNARDEAMRIARTLGAWEHLVDKTNKQVAAEEKGNA